MTGLVVGTTFLLSLAAIEARELSLFFILLAFACLAAAAYMAWLRNAVGCGLFVFVAVVAVILGT